MELNRDEIIKALECCTSGINHKGDIPCLDCPYDECNIVGGTSERQITGTCSSWLKKDTLSLIKELIEENERLKARVLEENHLRTQAEEMLAQGMSVVKADTVREVCQRIKEHFPYDADSGLYVVLDQIAKEMLEGDK